MEEKVSLPAWALLAQLQPCEGRGVSPGEPEPKYTFLEEPRVRKAAWAHPRPDPGFG